MCNVLHRGPDIQKVLKRCVECRGAISMNCITNNNNNNDNNKDDDDDNRNKSLYPLTNNTVETLQTRVSDATTSINTNSADCHDDNIGETCLCKHSCVSGVFVHTEMQAVSSVLGLRGTVPITQPYEVEETSDRRSLQTRQCSRHSISSPVVTHPTTTTTNTNNSSSNN